MMLSTTLRFAAGLFLLYLTFRFGPLALTALLALGASAVFPNEGQG